LPYFDIGFAQTLVKDRNYLRIILSRYSKNNKVQRLKRGTYVASSYVDDVQKKGIFSTYLEFIASAIYEPSYLSLEYVLQKYNAITEATVNFTLVSRNKTSRFLNTFGNFIYHNIKRELFTGFNLVERDGFPIYEATKAKALFDFLYLRKNLLVDKKAVNELRINIEVFDRKDRKEFEEYVNLGKSARLGRAGFFLFGQ
jgi:predicted transcriptional regulator of viral defense system